MMGAEGLQFETVSIAFTQGLDTRTQRKLVLPAKWDDLLNFTLSKDNTPQVRDAVQALEGDVARHGLATYNDELLSINGGYVFTYSTAENGSTMVPGRLGYVGVSKDEIRRNTGMQDTPDCATGGGYTLYAWREKSAANVVTGVSCTLIDETTGARIIDNFSMRANVAVFGVRCVYHAGCFFIFYIQGTSLYCRTILTTLPHTVNAEVALITSASLGALNFDACQFGAPVGPATAACMVSYAWADGVTSIRTIKVVNTAGVPSIGAGPTNLFTEAQLPVATVTGIAVCAESGAASAATFVTSTGAAAMAGLAGRPIATTWATAGAATQIDNAVAATTSPVHVTACVKDDATLGNGYAVFWDRESEWSTNALNPLKTVVVGTNMAVTLLTPSTLINSATFGAGINARGPQGPFIAGKAFNYGGTVFLPVFVGSVYNGLSPATANPRNANTQNSYFLLELLLDASLPSQLNMVAKALYGTYGLASINGTAPAVGTPCSIINPSTGVYAQVASELTLLVLASGNNVSPTGLVRLNLTPNTTIPAIRTQLGESTYFAGGSLTTYDGSRVFEHGFPLFPEGPAITVNGAGTGAMSAGVHQVVFIYEWVDNAGQRHQSAPSLPISVTTVATGSLTCQVPTLLLSQKGGGPSIATNIQVVAYMTTAGGLTFFRVLLDNGVFAPVSNSLAATTVTLTIDDSDATISGNEVLYTQPNIAPTTLANLSPPPCNCLCVAQNRLFFDVADQPFRFGYSQEYVNNLGLQFSPDLFGTVPAESGGIVALAEMDEKVIIFGRRRIYVMYGTGPTTSGGFNNYSKPQDIQADVGCSDARSVLPEYPGGIIFKAQKGFHVLQRDLSVKFIGEGVTRFDTTTVLAAVMLEDRKECRFVTTGTAGGYSGIVLVYSYLTEQWSYFVDTGADGYFPLDGIWWPPAGGGSGRFISCALVNSDGLNQDVPGSYSDSPGIQTAHGIKTIARTGWLHLSKLEGFQRVRWLYLSASTPDEPLSSRLSITVDFDDAYGSVADGSYTFGPVDLDIGLGAPRSVDLRHKLRKMKCKSVAFTFTDDAPATNTQRIGGIQAIALEVGVKKGVNRLPAAQGVG